MNEKEYANQIKNQYTEHTDTDVEKLIALDKKVKLPANIFAYTFGTIGSLVLGFGMCLAMKVLWDLMPLGIGIGLVGIAMVSANYFIYKAILKSRKNKYASQVLELSNQIMGE